TVLLYVFHFCKCILILTFEHANIQFFIELKGEKNRNFNKANIKRKKMNASEREGTNTEPFSRSALQERLQCTAEVVAVHCRKRAHNGIFGPPL
ncbi:MAG: hypothetical protein SOW60_03635, partial [Bacteroidaceae bacterium]|nr:hypothetical protein [Bacteroidaceae bacterium]